MYYKVTPYIPSSRAQMSIDNTQADMLGSNTNGCPEVAVN